MMKAQSGRALDDLIHERVMGEKLSRSYVYEDPDHSVSKHYSTDMTAAWQVFLKLGEGYALQNRGDHWAVFTGAEHWVVGEALNAPLAICLAALRVAGVTEQDEQAS